MEGAIFVKRCGNLTLSSRSVSRCGIFSSMKIFVQNNEVLNEKYLFPTLYTSVFCLHLANLFETRKVILISNSNSQSTNRKGIQILSIPLFLHDTFNS